MALISSYEILSVQLYPVFNAYGLRADPDHGAQAEPGPDLVPGVHVGRCDAPVPGRLGRLERLAVRLELVLQEYSPGLQLLTVVRTGLLALVRGPLGVAGPRRGSLRSSASVPLIRRMMTAGRSR